MCISLRAALPSSGIFRRALQQLTVPAIVAPVPAAATGAVGAVAAAPVQYAALAPSATAVLSTIGNVVLVTASAPGMAAATL